MSHYYKIVSGEPRLLKTVTTPAQARKSGAYHSVTTALSAHSNPFLTDWAKKECIKLGRENPQATPEAILELVYGTRECPTTGDTISSSDYGTNAHARMEAFARNHIITGHWVKGLPYTDYDNVCLTTVAQFEQMDVKPIHAEHKVWDDDLRIAGTVDLVANHDGRVSLFDFKFRSCQGGKPKTYLKDCAQLAVESAIIRHDKELGYYPPIWSICIDTDTGKTHFKQWSQDKFIEGLNYYLACNAMFLVAEMKLTFAEVVAGWTKFIKKSS